MIRGLIRNVICTIAVVGSASAALAGQPNSFFAGAGYVKPSDLDSGTTYFTGGVRIGVGENIAIEAEFGYWKESEGFQDVLRSGLDDKMVGGNLVFKPKMKGPIGVYLGAGPAVHFCKLSLSIAGYSGNSETSTRFGAQVLAGADVKLAGQLGLFATARYDLIGKPSWRGGTLETSVSGFKVYGGLRIAF